MISPVVRLAIAIGLAVGAAALLSSAGSAQTLPPSFDCRKASFADERVICSDDRLAEMDQAASIALGMVKKDMMKTAREEAFAQLKERHACGTNKMCIVDNQAGVIDSLDGYGAHVAVPPWLGAYRLSLIDSGSVPIVPDLPKRVGTCTRTKISGIGTRFGEPLKRPNSDADDTGSAVDFANEGHQVSYSYQAPIGDSAIGDPVVLCLVSVPKDCPPGDNRGRFYSTTNLRTKGSWILADSEHMCGGA